MLIMALTCVFYIGVTATESNETSSSSQEIESASSESSSSEEASSEETSSEESSSSEIKLESLVTVSVQQTVSSNKTSSTATSSRIGANATDKTGSVEGWGEPQSQVDVSLQEDSSEETSSKSTDQKNIFNLSKLLSILIVIPILLALASVGALVYVNNKKFTGESGATKTKEDKNASKKGKHTRKKN